MSPKLFGSSNVSYLALDTYLAARGLGQQAQLPRQQVVVASGSGVEALVQILHLASVDGHGLVGVGADDLTVADALGPGGAVELDVVGASEGVGLRSSKLGPLASKAVGLPATEVTLTIAANGLDHEQVLATTDVVNVGSLEEGVDAVLQGNDGVGKAIGEVGQGGLRAVKVTVVVGREEVAVGGVADDPHVNPVATANVLLDDVRLRGVEVLRGAPAVRVVDVLVGGVGSIAVLVNEVPQLLRSKVEDLGSSTVTGTDRGLVEVSELGVLSLGEIGEAEGHQVIARGGSRASKDVVFAVRLDDGRVLQGGDIATVILGSDNGTGRAPGELGGKSTSLELR